jgi:hypothetical protein
MHYLSTFCAHLEGIVTGYLGIVTERFGNVTADSAERERWSPYA